MARLIRTMARTAAISGTATAASGRVRNRQAQQFANQAAAQGVSAAKPTPSPEADLDHQIAALEKLAKLKEQGIITQEEFDAKKKQILGL
jgi:predicted Zn-dependent peptidase